MSRGGNNNQRRYRGERKRFADHIKANLYEGIESSPVLKAFESYRKELDAKHDKYERIIKLSRDITIESKRIIFLLHSANRDAELEKKLEEAKSRIKKLITTNFHNISKELEGEDPYLYMRAFSPGLQEFIEAYSFMCYLESGNLLPWQDVQKDMIYQDLKVPKINVSDTTEAAADAQTNNSNKAEVLEKVKDEGSLDSKSSESDKKDSENTDIVERKVLITPLEYALGIEDLTGELMRHAINSLSLGKIDTMFQTCNFVKCIYIGLLRISKSSKEFYKKLSVLKQSLLKIEQACYVVQVRGSEIPKHLLASAVVCQDNNVVEDEGIF